MIKFLRKNFFAFSILAVGVLVSALILQSGPAEAITVNTPRLPIQPGGITSDMILDGAIVNADVSTTAAISLDKTTSTANSQVITMQAQNVTGTKTFTSAPVFSSILNSFIGTNANGTIIAKDPPAYLAQTLTADEAISVGDAVAMITPFGMTTETSTAQDTLLQNTSTTGQLYMQTFTVLNHSINVTSVTMYVGSTGTSGGSFYPSVYNTSGSLPTGSALGAIAPQAVGSAPSPITFQATTNFELKKNTLYALEVNMAGNGVLPAQTGYQATSTYTHGTMYSGGADGTSWTPMGSSTMYFSINGQLGNKGDVMRASGVSSSSDSYKYFLGFANSSSSEGGTVQIISNGNASMLSGLTYPAIYYLANASGTVSSTAGSASQIVGMAISSTTLIIKHNNF